MQTPSRKPIQAKEPDGDEAIQSLAFNFATPADLPQDVQLFPPGRHVILAAKNGKPITLQVLVTPKGAESIQKNVADMLAAAEAGIGPRPYLDFNHDDKEASAWVQAVYWAGDDPLKGGIRAKIEWSKLGGEAVIGKLYRQFSPNFHVNDAGEIVGTTVNMGGLVNRPAFRKIEAFFAKSSDDGHSGGDSQHNTSKHMNKLHQALVAAGLLSAIPTDEAAATIEFSDKWNLVKAKLTAGDVAERLSKEQAGTITAISAERDAFKAKAATLAETNADTIIAKWVSEGILAPKDDDGKKLWRGLLIEDPLKAKLMEPVIAAKASAGGASGDVTKPVITKQGGQGGAPTGEQPHAFLVKAKSIATERKLSEGDAMIVAAKENGDLYEDYRHSTLYVGGEK